MLWSQYFNLLKKRSRSGNAEIVIIFFIREREDNGEESVLYQLWERESPSVWMKGHVYATLSSYGKSALSWLFHLYLTLFSLVMGPPRCRYKSSLVLLNCPQYLLKTASTARTWPTLLPGTGHTETAPVSFQWWAWLLQSFRHLSLNKCCKFAFCPEGAQEG